MEYLRDKEITPESHELPLVSQLQQELKEILVTKKSLSGPVKAAIGNLLKEDESLLIKYIRGRSGDLEAARKWIVRNVRAMIDLHPDLSPPDKMTNPLRAVFNRKILSVLGPANPNNGGLIMLLNIGAWDLSEISVDEVIFAGRYLAKVIIDSTNCYEAGITIIPNGAGMSFSHLSVASISTAKKCIDIFHVIIRKKMTMQTLAVYHIAVIFVNAPFYVYPVFQVLKPILPAKFKERLTISSGLSELHERIPLKSLPASLGGEMGDDDDEGDVTRIFLGLDDDCNLVSRFIK